MDEKSYIICALYGTAIFYFVGSFIGWLQYVRFRKGGLWKRYKTVILMRRFQPFVKGTSWYSILLPLPIFLFMMPFHSFAGDFDGSRPLKGSVNKIVEINQFRIRKDVAPDTVGLPQRFVIDFKDMVLRPSKDCMIRKTSKINRVEHVENKLVLQGFEAGVENIDDGLAWSLVISKITGKAVLAASGDGVAYVAFGTCTAYDNNQ